MLAKDKTHNTNHKYPGSLSPYLPNLRNSAPFVSVPSEQECIAIWDKYKMFPNIRRHSLMVAHIAEHIARYVAEKGYPIDIQATRAAALLHDIAKTYCVLHAGGHAMIGASITLMETGHYGLAQAVLLHVHWPWDLPKDAEICQMPILVLYADKRVCHEACVKLNERFEDILVRYGKTKDARKLIAESYDQTKKIEQLLAEYLGRDIHEDTFDNGRLVF